MPVSSLNSGTGPTPMSANHSGNVERRPPATTTRSAFNCDPSSMRTPVIRGSPLRWGSCVSPFTPTPVRNRTRPSFSTARRRTHSKVVRRQVSMVSS